MLIQAFEAAIPRRQKARPFRDRLKSGITLDEPATTWGSRGQGESSRRREVANSHKWGRYLVGRGDWDRQHRSREASNGRARSETNAHRRGAPVPQTLHLRKK